MGINIPIDRIGTLRGAFSFDFILQNDSHSKLVYMRTSGGVAGISQLNSGEQQQSESAHAMMITLNIETNTKDMSSLQVSRLLMSFVF